MRHLRLSWLFLLVLLAPGVARAGPGDTAIPPGRDAPIRELIDEGLGLDPAPGFSVDRDHIVVIPHDERAPRLIVFGPGVEPPSGEALAPGVQAVCLPDPPGTCTPAILDAWRTRAAGLALARDRLAPRIWLVDVDEADTGAAGPARAGRRGEGADRLGAALAILGGLVLAALSLRDALAHDRRRWLIELGLLAAIPLLATVLMLGASPLLPLHEHNSFIARSDCAIDPSCTHDPRGAWSGTSFHVYGLALGLGSYRIETLASWSLLLSVVDLALAMALAHRCLVVLERPAIAPWAAAATGLCLGLHPVFWRLATGATFWPYACTWALAGALAGIGAATREPGPRAAAGWLVAAACLGLACGGNLVLLTLGPLAVLAPACWARRGWARWGLMPIADSNADSGAAASPIDRWSLLSAAAALALLVAMLLPDYQEGVARAFGSGGIDHNDNYRLSNLWHRFQPILLEPTASGRLFVIPVLLAAYWLHVPRSPRLLVPLAYALLVPSVFLCVSAGELTNMEYPVGFINHHWDLVGGAVVVGMGVGVLLELAQRTRPASPWLGPSSAAVLVTLTLATTWALPLPRRLLFERRAVEHELVALQASFRELPEHDLLVVATESAPMGGLPPYGDPIEVNFPIGIYRAVLRDAGKEPGNVIRLAHLESHADALGELDVLVYVGTSLRSFQPPEIEAGLVPESLERPELLRLRDGHRLEPVTEFEIPTAQHEAIDLRLGADRVPTLRLGFYWLRPAQ